MNKIIEILEDINPGVDYEKEMHLIDDHLLDSLSIIALIEELEEEFEVSIPMVEIIPENFNSVNKMLALIYRLHD